MSLVISLTNCVRTLLKRRRRVCCIVIVKFVRSFPSLVKTLQTIILQIGAESRQFGDRLCQDIAEVCQVRRSG